MIKYSVRPAASTQRLLTYCDDIRFSMPKSFDHFKNLDSTDLISGQTIFTALDTVEKHSEDKFFYYELESYIQGNEGSMAKHLGVQAKTPAAMLACFASIYSSKLSSTKLQLLETDSEVKLISQRFSNHAVLKYGDLMLHTTIKSILSPFMTLSSQDLNIELPFDKRFYGKYADKFETVYFDTNAFSITVAKHPSEGRLIEKVSLNSSIPTLHKINAAANMLPPDKLSLNNIAFNLGCSERQLLKTLHTLSMPATATLQHIKFQRLKSQLIREKWNLKKAAIDFGYNDQSGLTKLFKNVVGVPPSEYRKNLAAL
ncbi:AraC family transcriptional regulator [Shewanella sp. Isolate13]|uniref:helix-turn-helix domain-containing protein n=1 Tax=Shewanella sp. Isolate13 TaxID=2908531 RepID=UPI001EFCD6F2|nr:AraC family transcriptional regulator [Shewanella sp. Isolate13]MCG9731818.1 AraC family transcriptional regulator [Shewanella sp. Isolate13]